MVQRDHGHDFIPPACTAYVVHSLMSGQDITQKWHRLVSVANEGKLVYNWAELRLQMG